MFTQYNKNCTALRLVAPTIVPDSERTFQRASADDPMILEIRLLPFFELK